jgi:hypothetical protein
VVNGLRPVLGAVKNAKNFDLVAPNAVDRQDDCNKVTDAPHKGCNVQENIPTRFARRLRKDVGD